MKIITILIYQVWLHNLGLIHDMRSFYCVETRQVSKVRYANYGTNCFPYFSKHRNEGGARNHTQIIKRGCCMYIEHFYGVMLSLDV